MMFPTVLLHEIPPLKSFPPVASTRLKYGPISAVSVLRTAGAWETDSSVESPLEKAVFDDEARERDARAQVLHRLMLVGAVLAPGERARDRGEHDHPDRRPADEPPADGTRRAQHEPLDRAAPAHPSLGMASPERPAEAPRLLLHLIGAGACHSSPFGERSRTRLRFRE